MKIRMLVAVNGKVNGERMGPYAQNGEYELDDVRAVLFIGSAMAEEVLPPRPEAPGSMKDLAIDAENAAPVARRRNRAGAE